MKNILIPLVLLILFAFAPPTGFKKDQLRYPRVRQAYADKEQSMKVLLKEKGIDIGKMEIFLRAFKKDKELELWGKNKTDTKFKLLKTFDICRSSGYLGPKRKQGDYQVPEGFYHIEIYNPFSNFYLSMGLNYPNESDRILGVKGNLGGDIYIHGACVTIGCIPLTDDGIKELYIYCVEAKNNGQQKIPVTIFPTKMTDANHVDLLEKHDPSKEVIGLWEDLKKAYQHFEKNKTVPRIRFLDDGRHSIN